LLDSTHSVVKGSEAKKSSELLVVEEINTSSTAPLMEVTSFLPHSSIPL